MTTNKEKNAQQKPDTKDAQGLPTVTSSWSEKIKDIRAENIPSLQTNVHYRDAVNNIIRQVFPAPPEIWVTNPDEETDEELTTKAKAEYSRLHGYDLQQYVITDHYGYGCFVHSDGIDKINGEFVITEIRHLPCETFGVPPTTGYNYITPNPLMPGVVVNAAGETEVWQTNPHTYTPTKIENFKIVRPHGTPDPSGDAYMYPTYFLIAEIDHAAKAENQQLNRIGAPPLLPKAIDTIRPEKYLALEEWFKKFLKKWGKDSSALLPPGIEFPSLQIREGTTAERYIKERVDWIRSYTNPVSDLQQAGTGIGTSDSGRMEMWTTFIAAEQNMSEVWLEELFDWILEANGYEGYHTHIRLRRPSVDKASLRLQYMTQLVAAKAITLAEIRDNATDVLDLRETTPDVEMELQQRYPPSLGMFGNTMDVDGFSRPEDKIMGKCYNQIAAMNDTTAEAIKKIMKYPEEK